MSLLFTNTLLNKKLPKFIDTEIQTNSNNNEQYNDINNYYFPNVITTQEQLFKYKNMNKYNKRKNKLKSDIIKKENKNKNLNKKNFIPISLKNNYNSIDFENKLTYKVNPYFKNNFHIINNDENKIKNNKINNINKTLFSNSYIAFNISKKKKNLENLEYTFINNHKNELDNINNNYYLKTLDNSYNNNYRTKKYKKFIIPKKIRVLNINQKTHDINLFNHLNLYKDYDLKFIENAHKINKIKKKDEFLNKIKKDQLNLKFNNKIKYFN